MEKHFADTSRQAELWITYSGLTGKADIRHAKRKVAFSDAWQEVLLAGLPLAKKRLRSKGRSTFAVCGETSTHNLTYSAVEPRRFDALPKLLPEEKERMVGGRMKPLPEELDTNQQMRGHPLFWQEFKTSHLFSALFDDFDIGHVFDLSPGSGAAAMAAAATGIGYEGVAENEMHAQWLETLLDLYCPS